LAWVFFLEVFECVRTDLKSNGEGRLKCSSAGAKRENCSWACDEHEPTLVNVLC
jgi:hypothetical protein